MIEMYLGMSSGGWAIDGRTQAWSAHADPVQALAHWTQEIESKQAGRWRKAIIALWLSGGLARPFLCGPVAGLTNWAEAEAMAIAAAPEATGLDGACRVQLEGWPGDAAVLCTAIEASIAQAIAEAAKMRRIAWRSVRPRWAALLDEALARQPSLGLVAFAEEDAFTLLGSALAHSRVPSSAAFELAATYAPAPDAERTTALWRRTMLSRDVRPDEVWFADLETPAASGVFLAPEQSVHLSRWPDARRRSEASEP